MTSACVQRETGVPETKILLQCSFPQPEQQSDTWDVQTTPYKENASRFIQEAPGNQKGIKNPAKQVPHCVPQVHVTARRATQADVQGACQGADALGSESASLAWPLGPSDSVEKCRGEGKRVTGTKHPQRSTWPLSAVWARNVTALTHVNCSGVKIFQTYA